MSNRPMLKFVSDYTTAAQVAVASALLYHLACSNNSASTIWVQIWDVNASSQVGTTGHTIPDFEVAVPASPSILAVSFHKEGWQMGNGIYVRAVTASQGSSLIGGNNAKFSVQYDSPWIA